MKSIGVSHKHSMATEANEDTKIHPSSTIDHRALPGMKKHQVGDTGHMKIKYKVTGQNSYRNGEGHTNIDLTHAELIPGTKTDEEQNEKAQKDAADQSQEVKK